MDVSGRLTAFITMKVPPEVRSQAIKVGGAHVDIAGSQSGSTQMLKKALDIPDRIEDMAANDDVSLQIRWSVLPGCGSIGNVANLLLCCILLEIMQHRGIRLDSYYLLCMRRKSQHRTPGSSSYIQYGCLW